MENNTEKCKNDHKNYSFEEGIAIIGMSGRFPGAKTMEEFWDILATGRSSIKLYNKEELKHNGVKEQIINHPDYIPASATIDNLDQFDEKFFSYLPLEASVLDPQHRIFLEICYEALENAGYTSKKYHGSIGAFAGTGESSYFTNYVYPHQQTIELFGLWESKMANSPNLLANRVSYKLNLKGPSLNINTACSTSLVSVIIACENLENFKCDIAIAGGVHLIMPNEVGYVYREGGILSSDGYCRTFDELATGTVPGTGAGVVVLKRLKDALEDGDTILASIRGFSVNNDGSNKAGFTAPSVEGQKECIIKAFQKGNVLPNTISYIEAHGTGTQLGDAIEIQALKEVFSEKDFVKYSCALGSVKSNIGHADIAAGIMGLIKVILCLKNKTLVPHIGVQVDHQHRDLKDTPFYINTHLTPWKPSSPNIPLRAAISSFGIGGTNAHLIVEEVVSSHKSAPLLQNKNYIFCLSGKTSHALDSQQHNLLQYMKEENPILDFSNLVYTLNIGREDHPIRMAFSCKEIGDAITYIENSIANDKISHQELEGFQGVVFMFPGQAIDYANISKYLYNNEYIFKSQIDECCDYIIKKFNINIYNNIFKDDNANKNNNALNTLYDQLSIFLIEYSLANLLMNWGINPIAMIGHSLGEYVAACLSGVVTLAEALELIFWRGKFMQMSESGSMLAVRLSQRDIAPFISDQISLAAVNAPSECVVSGNSKNITLLRQQLENLNIKYKQLNTNLAFHSSMMYEAANNLREIIKKINFKEPKIPYISNVTGTWIKYDDLKNNNYWIDHMCQTVKFSTGIRELQEFGKYIYFEVGPGSVLSSYVKMHHANAQPKNVIPIFQQDGEEYEIYTGLAKLWCLGINIDWAKFYHNREKKRIPLPTYPFEKRQHWINNSNDNSGISSDNALGNEKSLVNTTLPKHCQSKDFTQNTRNDIEQVLVDIWEDVFSKQSISVFDDYFDLGGNSLTAIQLISIIRKKFSIELPISKFFENTTITKLAEAIRIVKSTEGSNLLPPLVAYNKNVAPLSFIQEQFWFLDKLAGSAALHNLCTTFQIHGNIKLSAIKLSLEKLIKRHKVLGSALTLVDGKLIQVYKEDFSIDNIVNYIDLSNITQKKQKKEVDKLLHSETSRPFNLSDGPLTRIQLIRINAKEHILTLSVHHAACDGWSLNILFKEFSELYNSQLNKRTANLTELQVQYSDFAIWQRESIPQKLMDQQLIYWKEKLHNLPTRIQLPLKKNRPRKQNYQGKFYYFAASKDILEKIKIFCKENDITFFMFMLTIFSLLLHERSKQNDIIIGTPIANRHYTHAEELIGCFLNMLPLRINYDIDLSFVNLLQQVKLVTLESYENRDIPFRTIVNQLRVERNLSYNPIFQTCMYIQTNDAGLFHFEGTKSKVRTQASSFSELQTSKFDLTLWIQEEKSLSLGFEYASELFEKEIIIQMANDFILLLNYVTNNPNHMISEIKKLFNQNLSQYSMVKESKAHVI